MPVKSHVQEPVRRLGWLIAIWLLSIIALGVFAMVFRFIMSLAGLTE
ncbi:DUF2474 domain-containing protein [Agrobacterium tumefaciens]|nr:DUF2474 domain-containing protein [Agrobacterium tumefaciens]MDS7593909.1 DUF2474 domain-containing protein [Agrobacterium tumefaciens]